MALKLFYKVVDMTTDFVLLLRYILNGACYEA